MTFESSTTHKIKDMIDITKLTEEDKGRKVIFSCDGMEKEEGIITSWNTSYIFVDYSNSGRGIATRPGDLEFTFK